MHGFQKFRSKLSSSFNSIFYELFEGSSFNENCNQVKKKKKKKETKQKNNSTQAESKVLGQGPAQL